MAFDAVLLDFDGTIVDTSEHISRAFRYALAEKGYPDITSHQMALYAGKPLAFVYEAVTGAEQSVIAELRALHKQWQDEHLSVARLFPDTLAVLDELETRGVKWGIATARYRSGTLKLIDYFGFNRYDFPLSCGDDGYPAKPNPAIFAHIAESLGATPTNCLVVGDGVADIMAGKAMHAKTAWAKYGYGGAEPLPQPADYTLEDLSGVLELL
ncbi:hypothetical protein AUJ14_01250 [Candidatus Micrarchaeota archaeon CG1_02_55_22]|nr:MAG: hypothetical protein AUJ14_01250 [Candidatus Micrarchaeota archaeon CG1_02_55_22]